MTLQWTAVAFFLYAEIAVNIILCTPFISPQRWRLVFSWRIWNWLSPYWNKCFFTMIMVLIVLFLDAVRDVQKYSGPEPMHDAKVAVTSENSAGLQVEMDIAIKAAKQHQDDNLMLRHALLDEERSKSAKNQLVKLEVEKLVEQVKASEEAVRKSHAEVEAMKRQAKGLAQEYDRLLMEHHQLQNLQSAADKKDQ
ncbi:B-cell receptor-associated protein 29-like isoform X2 [Micropterus salmoides]|uniref:B-cell receptor-associated protein 29-like isoform X2 n=1 Tax=Micropterus salmoides TaxID=27706 RepID=UPI0018ED1174|nr:B-cell receptor-associated protein 29-like isoform X2 [Micropterus salmoides]